MAGMAGSRMAEIEAQMAPLALIVKSPTTAEKTPDLFDSSRNSSRNSMSHLGTHPVGLDHRLGKIQFAETSLQPRLTAHGAVTVEVTC